MYILSHRKATGFSFIVLLITKISNIHESLKASIKNFLPIRSWPYLIYTNIYSFHFLDYFEEMSQTLSLKILICNSKKWVLKKTPTILILLLCPRSPRTPTGFMVHYVDTQDSANILMAMIDYNEKIKCKINKGKGSTG